jgi:prepilin-type N-terminal cleavage/methylation domain-containing protein
MNTPSKGFTLIELIVVIVIISLLASVAIPKFMNLTEKAEAAAVKNILGSVRSALSLKVASGLVNGDTIEDWTYDGAAPLNPMNDLLAEKPETYLGVITVNPGKDKVGHWWDRNAAATDHWLMYKLRNESLVSGGWSSAGTNIVHHIDDIQDSGETVGLYLDSGVYSYTWND